MTGSRFWRQLSLLRCAVQAGLLLVSCFLLFQSAQAHSLRISPAEISKTRVARNVKFEVTYTITNIFNDPIPEDTMMLTVRHVRGSRSSAVAGYHDKYIDRGAGYTTLDPNGKLPALDPGESLTLGMRFDDYALGTHRFQGCISHLDDRGERYHEQCGDPSQDSIEIVRDESDLSVELTTQPATVMAGLPFSLVATVRNAGPWYSAGTTEVHYYYSETDSNQNRDYEHLLEIKDTGDVPPGGDRRVLHVGRSLPDVGRRLYFFACAGLSPWQNDANPENNCSQPILVHVQEPYDLRFVEVSADGQPYGPSEIFPLTVGIENAGEGQSPPFRLYVTTSSRAGGGDAMMNEIPPGGRSSHVFEISTPAEAPPQSGISYTACLAIHASDADGVQRSQCADPVTVRVDPGLDRGYDFAFGSVEWLPYMGGPVLGSGSPNVPNDYLLTFRLVNLGQARSRSTTLAVWRSTDDSADSRDDDQQVASSEVRALDPGDQPLRQYRPPGDDSTGYYYACLTSFYDELNPDNNCSTPIRSNRLVLSPANRERAQSIMERVFSDPRRLDLHASGALMEDDTYTDVVPVGEYFNIRADISNRSQVMVGNVVDRFYRSVNQRINPSRDTEIMPGSVRPPYLVEPGGSVSHYLVLQPTTVGDYYYGFCVHSEASPDGTVYECSNGVQISVVERVQELRSAPLTMGTGPNLHPLGEGSQLEKIPSGRFGELTPGRKKDEGASDGQVGKKGSFGSLVPSGKAGGPAGARPLKGSPVTLKPLLTFHLSGLKAQAYLPGERGTVKVQLKNAGSQAVGPLPVELQISPEKIFKQNRKKGEKEFREVKAGRGVNGSFNIVVPREPGMYYLRACAAPVKLCSDPVELTVKTPETKGLGLAKKDTKKGTGKNTAKTGLSMPPMKHGNPGKKIILFPDLVVLSSNLAAGKSAPGGKVKVTAIVKNVGTGKSADTDVDLVQSADKKISKKDATKATVRIPSLKPEEEKKVEMSTVAGSAPGSYYYGVCVDALSNELQAANNCSKIMKLLVAEKTTVFK